MGLFILTALIKPKHPVGNTLIALGFLLGYGFLIYGTRLTLDLSTQTATLREFQFYHWSEHTYPLSQIHGVFVRTGSTNDALELQFSNGDTRPISFMDQYGGKEKAAFRINQFLAQSDPR